MFDTLTGKLIAQHIVDEKYAREGSWFGNATKTSSYGNVSVISNCAAHAIIKRIDSGHEYDITANCGMLNLPPEPDKYRPTLIACAVTVEASHVLSRSGDALFVESDRPFGRHSDETTRDRLYRRNHPEEWWGLACTNEFWLVAALAAGLLWSLIRDWRELPRI